MSSRSRTVGAENSSKKNKGEDILQIEFVITRTAKVDICHLLLNMMAELKLQTVDPHLYDALCRILKRIRYAVAMNCLIRWFLYSW